MIAFLITALLVAQEPKPRNHAEVIVTVTEEETLVTIKARDARVESLVEQLARSLGREVQGFDRVIDTDPITVYLEDRPVSEALNWVLGSAGLRGHLSGNTFIVENDTTPFPTREELYSIAESSFIRAQKDAPEFERAADAEMARAEIQEERGQLASAVVHYDFVFEHYPESGLVPDALLRAGLHLETLEEWSMAAERFRALADLRQPHAYHTLARRLLARSLCFASRPEKALQMLDALETNYPTQEREEIRERLLVRSRALCISARPIEALRVLDIAEGYGAREESEAEFVELLGMGLELSGRAGEAALAWLALGDKAEGRLKGRAFENAARLSIDAGDDLGALLIHARASDEGFGESVEYYANEARRRLGLLEENFVSLTSEQQLAHAETLLVQGRHRAALRSLEKLFYRREQLDRETLMRVGRAYATALHETSETVHAVRMLRDTVALLDRREDRKELYLLASELYESRGMIDQALEALQGKL